MYPFEPHPVNGYKICLNLWDPFYRTWLNNQISDAHLRATLFSISSQADAIGQMTCGPIVGLIVKIGGLRLAFYASAVILTPAFWLYGRLQPAMTYQLESEEENEEGMF